MKIIYFSVLMFLLFLCRKKRKDLLDPVFVNLAIWITLPFLYEIVSHSNDNYRILSNKFYTYVFGYCICFTFITLFMTRKVRNISVKNRFEKINDTIPIINKLIKINVISNLLLFIRLIMISGEINLIKVMTMIRTKSIEEQGIFTPDIKLLLFLFNFTPLLLAYVYMYGVKVNKLFWVLVAEMILISFLLSTKGRIIRAFFILFIAMYHSIRKYRRIAVTTIAVICVAIILFMTLNRDAEFFTRYTLGDYVFLYTLSPLPALDRLLCGELSFISDGFGTRSLAFFYRLFSSFFGISIPLHRNPGFINIPTATGNVQTNVFTVLGIYYMDYEALGYIVCAVIYALMFGYSYKKMVVDKRKEFAIFFLLNFPYLILQFFGDFIMPTLSITIQEFLCALVIATFNNKYSRVRIVLRR